MISYDNLWDVMKEKGITQYALIKAYTKQISSRRFSISV